MPEPLSLRHRPFSFAEVAGQLPVQLVLNRMIHTREGIPLDEPRIFPAMLFTGDRGTGKTSTARIFAAALNCTHAGRRPCGNCASCCSVRSGNHPDVLEIDAASYGRADDIRGLRESASYVSAGNYRLIVLDECHAMSRAAYDALLKILEEPPPCTVFVLVTTEESKVPRTVVSRCVKFTFRRLSPSDIAARLRVICERDAISAEPALLWAIAERADGGMRDAVVMLDQMSSVEITTAAHFEKFMGESDFAPSLVSAMADGAPDVLFARLEDVLARTGDYVAVSGRLVSCLRDLLVLGTGGTVAAQGEALAARKTLASRLPAGCVAAAMQVLWELRRMFSAGDSRSALDMAMVLCMEKLNPVRSTAGAVPAKVNGHAPATLDDLRAIVGA